MQAPETCNPRHKKRSKKTINQPDKTTQSATLYTFCYWQHAYLDGLKELNNKAPCALPFEECHPEYTVASLSEFKKNVSGLQNLGDNLYVFNNQNAAYCTDSTALFRAMELFSRYASYTFELDKPLYAVSDFASRNIQYAAYFQLSNKGVLNGLVLYDNYETTDAAQYQLRFEWWQPESAKELDDSSFEREKTDEATLRIQAGIDRTLGEHIEETSLKARLQTQVKRYQNSPISSNYSAPLYQYHWQQNLSETQYPFSKFKPSAFQKLHTDLNDKLQASTEEQLRQAYFTDHPVKPQHLELTNTLAYWDMELYRTIQLPRIDYAPYRENIIPCPNLNGQYTCLYFHNEIPREVTYLISRYSYFLNNEIAVRVTIRPEEIEQGYSAFLILNSPLNCCYGYFTFKLSKDARIIPTIQKTWLDNEDIQKEPLSFFNTHRKACQDALTQHVKNRPKQNSFSFLYRTDEQQEALQNQLNIAKRLSLYKAAKGQLPTQDKPLQALEFAWVHPFHRSHGILSALWPIFKQELGVIIDVEMPSYKMKQFIKKHALATLELSNSNVLIV